MKSTNLCGFGCKDLLSLDEGISELVFALNFLEIKTYSSCQGHRGRYHHSYPWVAIGDTDYDRLEKIINRYNYQGHALWTLKINPPSKKWILRPSRGTDLNDLSREVELLASFLWRQAKRALI